MKKYKVKWRETRVFACESVVEAETEDEACDRASECADFEREMYVSDCDDWEVEDLGDLPPLPSPYEYDPNQLELIPRLGAPLEAV